MKKGLTLVEVMIVIAVLGILAAIALPRFGGVGFLTKRTLENEARRIQSDLRLTRTLAITNGVDCILKVDTIANEYKIYKGGIAPGNQVGETRVIKSGITASGDDTVTFQSLGNAAAATLILTSGGSQYNVAVTAATGRIEIAPAP